VDRIAGRPGGGDRGEERAGSQTSDPYQVKMSGPVFFYTFLLNEKYYFKSSCMSMLYVEKKYAG
jgi:hypothetical protein